MHSTHTFYQQTLLSQPTLLHELEEAARLIGNLPDFDNGRGND